LHNSEYGTFHKEGKLIPTGELSDGTPDELQSVEQTQHRQHFNIDESDIATANIH